MKRAVTTAEAPAAIGPYSQAVEANGLVFLSGQIPLDPKTGKLVAGGIAEQTAQVMKNLRAVLDAAGCAFDDVVQATVYVADLADFATVNQVYGQHFHDVKPARATVQVAALPAGALVEVALVAAKSK